MIPFMSDDFLLQSETARRLYHEYAADMPIFDYHCHLPPAQIAGNTRFENLSGIWLAGDHYKWRAMRTNGIAEKYITGDADDFEKFLKWAETVPYTVGNPLYQWTHLELKTVFGISGKLLNPSTAREIWDTANSLLAKDEFRPRGLMEKFRVKVVCTTDDPADSLEYHKQIAADGSFSIKVLPTFRPDKAYGIEDPVVFSAYLEKLSAATNVDISNFKQLIEALKNRIEYFHSLGCRLSDHALLRTVFQEADEREIETIFSNVLAGKVPSEVQAEAFKTAVLLELGRTYAEKGWTMQLHIGALRNNNFRMMQKLGPDTGFDSVADYPVAFKLSRFLDRLDETDQLPKTILYSLNPSDNAVLASMIGNFQDGSVAGKMQFGSAWWVNDQRDGMDEQMRVLANMGLLSRFVGMLTDSRSFLSYPRHEYFRRVLCDLIGRWVENGELPQDYAMLGGMVRDICFNNAAGYFGIPTE